MVALPSTEYLADTPTLAGPGFINAKISSQWMGARIQNMLRNGIKTWAPRLNRKRVVIDFSSPNVAKEMHVGHLRSTIIGDTLSRTLEFCGADVLRLNHVVSACGHCLPLCLADLQEACFSGPQLYLLDSCVWFLPVLFADLFVGVLSIF